MSVDEFRCDGHGVCVDVCPEVFGFQGDDVLVTVFDAQPPEELREAVEDAAAGCPKAAIIVDD